MQKNDLLRNGESIVRVLAVEGDRVLIIDCAKLTMPKWRTEASLADYVLCKKNELLKDLVDDVEDLKAEARKVAYQRYTMISGVLPYVADDTARGKAICKAADENNISSKTIRKYLCQIGRASCRERV